MAENSGIRKSNRKARSKSLGPGGLDALMNQENRGEDKTSAVGKPRKRRESMTPASQVKGILLPTVPISPRAQTSARVSMSRRRTSLLNLPKLNLPPKPMNSSNPFLTTNDSAGGVTKSIPLRTEEEQAAAARERQKKDILASRAERRKSLGNRRVSFATEATLHTFAVDDYPATPSSGGGPSRDTTPAQPKKGKGGKRNDRRDSFPGPEPDSDSDSGSDEESFSPIEGPEGLGRLVDPSEQGDNSSNSDAGSDSESESEDNLGKKKSEASSGNNISSFPHIAPMEFDEEEEMRKDMAKEKEPVKSGSGAKGLSNFFKKPITVIRGDPPSAKKQSPKTPQKAASSQDDEGEVEMDITRTMGGVIHTARSKQAQIKPSALFGDPSDDEDGDSEVPMEITRAIDGVIASRTSEPGEVTYPTLPSNQSDEEAAMDLTRPIDGLMKTAQFPSLPPFASEEQDGNMDVDGDQTMEMDFTVARGFIKPKKSAAFANDDQTMDLTMAVGGIKQNPSSMSSESEEEAASEDELGDMTMDMTLAVGGIIDKPTTPPARKKGGRRRSSTIGAVLLQNGQDWARQQEVERQLQKDAEEHSEDSGSDMDMTVAGGRIMEATTSRVAGVITIQEESQDTEMVIDQAESDEGDDMEMTAIIPSAIVSKAHETQITHSSEKAGSTAPMTSQTESISNPPPVAKQLQSPITEQSAPPQRRTLNRSNSNTPTEIAVKSGKITAPSESPLSRVAKEDTTDVAAQSPHTSPPKKRVTRSSLGKGKLSSSSPAIPPVAVSKTPSPVPAPRPVDSQPSEGSKLPQTPPPTSTATSTNLKSSTLLETPPRNQTEGGDGFTLSARRRLTKPPNPSTPIAKTPQRRISGIGIDKPGLGSPNLLASINRRQPLGHISPMPIDFNSPKVALLSESSRFVAEQMREEKAKESEAYLTMKREMERAKNESLPLKERIESMTPKKSNPRKRTSMEPDTASNTNRDLFGEPNSGSKAMKRRSMGLNKPPVVVNSTPEPETSQEPQTRVTRSRASLPGAAPLTHPPAPVEAPKPLSPVLQQEPAREPSPEIADEEPEEDVPRITMKQFLEMTSISFLDNITYTTRRQTLANGARRSIAPKPSTIFKKGAKEAEHLMDLDEDEDREATLGDWITAGAATMPVFQLFYSSCLELKRHIAEEQKVIAELDAEVNKKNPRLFREYMDNPMDVRLIMDTQFKNIKTHARLLAKQKWYGWRMTQLNQLNEALDQSFVGLQKDEEVLTKQCEIINATLPAALKARNALKNRLELLKERRRELEACDPQELAKARERLVELRKEVERKKELARQKREDVVKLDEGIEERRKKMQKLKEEIDEAERIKEMNRGFSEEEVWALRDTVRSQEQKSGWSIVSIDKATITMSYHRNLLLSFDASTPTNGKPQLIYRGEGTVTKPEAVEQQYFFDLLQEKVKSISTGKEAIKVISKFWTASEKIVSQIAKTRGQWITTCSYTPKEQQTPGGKNYLEASVKIMLPEDKARLLVQFTVDGEALFKSTAFATIALEEAHFSDVVEVLAKPLYCAGQRKVSLDAANGKIRGGVTGASAMGIGAGWRGIVRDVIGKCFEVPVARKAAQATQQSQPATSTRVTPRKAAAKATPAPGKKIPVRAATIPTESSSAPAVAAATQSTATDKPSTTSAPGPAQSRLAKPSAIPSLFDKNVAPFGTGKRGIPVPTKAAHEDREIPR